MRNEKRVKELIALLKSKIAKNSMVLFNIKITGDRRFVFAISIYKVVWKYFYVDIPLNYEIHHKDFDKYNDDISNLQMLTKEEHKKNS